MNEAHKVGRHNAKVAAINSKSTSYLDKRYQVRQSHNFIGNYIEKVVYLKDKITVYDAKGNKIETQEIKKAAKAETKKAKTS